MIAIKGMDMPKEAGKMLHLDINQYGEVWADDEYIGELVKEIPTPHGRLIDADELSHQMYHQAFETDSNMQKWKSGCWVRYKMFENEMNNAPTILEAEEYDERL